MNNVRVRRKINHECIEALIRAHTSYFSDSLAWENGRGIDHV